MGKSEGHADVPKAEACTGDQGPQRLTPFWKLGLSIAAWSVLIGLVLPFVAATCDDSLNGERVSKQPDFDPQVLQDYQDQKTQRKQCNEQLALLESHAASGLLQAEDTSNAICLYAPPTTPDGSRKQASPFSLRDTKDLKEVIELRRELKNLCETLKDKVVVAGYYDSNVKWLWVGLLFTLGSIVAILCPRAIRVRMSGERSLCMVAEQFRKFRSENCCLTLVVWAVYRIDPLLRNAEAAFAHCLSGTGWHDKLALSSLAEERKVHSWTNADISMLGWLCQEVNAFVVAVLLAMIWRLSMTTDDREHDAAIWHPYAAANDREPSDLTSESRVVNPNVLGAASAVSALYGRLVICSILLCLGFLPYTQFFWRMVRDVGDDRYFAQAIIVHVLWVVTWIALASPFVRIWIRWESLRAQFYLDEKLKALVDLQPVRRWHAAVSAIVAFGAALLPLVLR